MNVCEEVSRHLLSHNLANVVIAGITCSGKTTLANKILGCFSAECAVSLISQDDYFKNLPDIPRSKEGYLTDSIEAFHTTEFVHDVKQLLQNSVTVVPRYNVATNTRVCKNKIVRAGKVNIFEGLHTIHLLSKLDDCICIFVDTKVETCLERRILRDTSKYGVPKARIVEYWDECIIPMCKKFIFPQRAFADIIINCCEGGETNDG